jgi:hypothetical protein
VPRSRTEARTSFPSGQGDHALGRILPVGEVARLDLERQRRTGVPEIVLAEGKRDGDLAAIARALALANGRAIVSRLAPERAHLVRSEGVQVAYHEQARLAILGVDGARPPPAMGTVGVLAAGSADVPVCEEARLVAEECGARVRTAYDVGVAGVQRLLDALRGMEDADVLVAAAGREGALPTVLAGLARQPVIGLPVSTGYGVGGQGQAALYSMLQSCAPLLVVNIDAGTVAGACAAKVAARIAEARKHG